LLGLETFNLVLSILVIRFWYLTVSIDPEYKPEIDDPNKISKNCLGYPIQRSTMFCSSCRKTIQGLDHHCLFLNNCIGTKNYQYFILLVIIVTLQMVTYVAWPIAAVTNHFSFLKMYCR
jgi:palmitoyltransferase ZDHHC1/11